MVAMLDMTDSLPSAPLDQLPPGRRRTGTSMRWKRGAAVAGVRDCAGTAPMTCLRRLISSFPEREAWWQKAREDVKQYTALYSWIPDTLMQEQQDLLFENLYEFVSMLIAEIIASPDADCTYFREQLAWFNTGHFPCGWEGDWPSGRIRVF